MSLIDNIRKDAQRIISDSKGFGQEITLTAPNGFSVIINGLHKKIWLGVDTEGNVISSKSATITIADNDLVTANYPYRNSSNEVSLNGHKISVKDITGLSCSYIIQSWHPDETIGIIVCYLQDFE